MFNGGCIGVMIFFKMEMIQTSNGVFFGMIRGIGRHNFPQSFICKSKLPDTWVFFQTFQAFNMALIFLSSTMICLRALRAQ